MALITDTDSLLFFLQEVWNRKI